jgi:2-keto-4-pentenoate hydratase/2-oxohepta-3-ene-1,7-dioic acid hydratase in catechol pathway
MRLCMFTPVELDLARGWPGRIDGGRVVQLAAQTLQAFFTGGGSAREHAEYPLADVRLLAPVRQPPAIRVYPASGTVFSFRNPSSVLDPDRPVRRPDDTAELRHGAGLAAMIGAEGGIGGITLLNAWSAPDLGPDKGSDFGTSLGPAVATLDDLPAATVEVVVRVGGVERERIPFAVDWASLVAHAARNTILLPGDLVAVVAPAAGEPLEPGALVELEAAGVGTLRTPVD